MFCRLIGRASIPLVALALLGAPALGSAAPVDSEVRGQPVDARPLDAPAPATKPSPAEEGADADGSGVVRFFQDVGSDYWHFVSLDTAKCLSIGGAGALVIHQWDEEIQEEAAETTEALRQTLEGGDKYGNVSYQAAFAVAWWAIASAAGSHKAAEAGRDLVRAQISAASWTFAMKLIAGRERPNGEPRSFPSGHTSATFATATALQRHYGWKLGLPFYALASYTGVSRVTDDKHWASDVVFGAFVGIASGRTVTWHLRSRTVTLSPVAAPGGAGVSMSVR